MISARVGSWGGSLALVQQRTGQTVVGGAEALAEAERELKHRLPESPSGGSQVRRALAVQPYSERKKRASIETYSHHTSRTATVLRVLIALPSDVAEEREV